MQKRTINKKVAKTIKKDLQKRKQQQKVIKNRTGGPILTQKRVRFIKTGGAITKIRVGGEEKAFGPGGPGTNQTLQEVFDESILQDGSVNALSGGARYIDDGISAKIEAIANGHSASLSEVSGLEFAIRSAVGGGAPSAVFIDTRGGADQKGIEYDGDYSANFGNESLVTKRYVDNAISGAGAGNIYTTDGILTGDRIISTNAHNFDIETDARVRFSRGLAVGSVEFWIENNIVSKIVDNGNETSFVVDNGSMIATESTNGEGIKYSTDYSATFTDRSLIDKAYVDNAVAGAGGGSSEWTKTATSLSPSDTNVDTIKVQKNFNGYALTQLRNDDDAGNGAGAVLELKGSGADYTNNVYFGKYGASFWVPELAGNGALMTDQDLIIGSVDNTKKTRFVVGNSYVSMNVLAELDPTGFKYTSDLSASWTDRNLVDKGYVDTKTQKLDFITVTQPVDLDQMELDLYSLSSGMTYEGDWDASSGSFPVATNKGAFFYVSVAGMVDGVQFDVGDNIVATQDNPSVAIYAGNWSKHDQTDSVPSVFGRTGAITAQSGDYDASQISETPGFKIFTNAERLKLAGIADGAEVNVQSDWAETNTGADSYIQNKPLLAKQTIDTVDPTINSDNGLGYEIGSRWYNTTSDEEFVCLDAGTGVAVWKSTTELGGGGSGVFESAVSNSVIREALGTGRYNRDFIVGSPTLSDDGNSSHFVRMFFDKAKGAFRAGKMSTDGWDDVNVGIGSVAFGEGNTASGDNSFASGLNNVSDGNSSVAMGASNSVLGNQSVGLGNFINVTGDNSVGLGLHSTVGGNRAFAFGTYVTAGKDYSTVFGRDISTRNDQAFTNGIANAKEERVPMEVTTTDNTPTLLELNGATELGIHGYRTILMEIKVIARQTGGATGSIGDTRVLTPSSGISDFVFKKGGSGLVKLYGASSVTLNEGTAGMTATMDIGINANNNIEFTVHGENGRDLQWGLIAKLTVV